MRRSRPKRGAHRRPARRIDLTDLREAVRDRRQWLALGKVIVGDGQTSHYQVVEEGGEVIDILVDVETVPDKLDLTCSLQLTGGAIMIPAVGDEVWVAMPAGRIDFRPVIIAVARGFAAPAGHEPTPMRILIVAPPGGEVVIHDGAGGTDRLVRKSEHVGHTHGPGTFAAGGDPVLGTSAGAPDIDGTPVLRA